MPQQQLCSKGHSWEAVPSDGKPENVPTCPVCGELLAGSQQATTDDAQETGAYQPAPDVATASDLLTKRADVPGYEIQGVLGRGGMGVVYKARQVALKRLVALKMIRTGEQIETRQRERFRLEAEAVARLQHPHIVQIHEVGEHAGQPFFSLEYVAGGSLAQKLAGTPQPPREAATLLETLARAMHAAHQQGIVHRDLKPANVLLTAGGEPKIGDFGLAKQMDQDSGQTQAGQVMGTPSYMSPEQANAAPEAIGPATDVYALGAILYETLTGRPPFTGATLLETLDQVRTQEPVHPTALNPRLPRDLETICLKCLHKEPGRRYASALDMAEDLRRFLNDEPIRARPVGKVERFLRWCRRNPRVAGLSAALALAVLALAIGSPIVIAVISHERNLALENEKTANRNAGIANKQTRLALDTLYSVITKVDQQLRDKPDMRALRLKLIEDAMEGLSRVERTADYAALLDRMVGFGHMRKADIFENGGENQKATEEHETAVAIFERLVATDPTNDWARWNLAISYDGLGGLARARAGASANADDYTHKALAQREQLAAGLHGSEVTMDMVRQALINSYAKLCTIAMTAGRTAEARRIAEDMVRQAEAMAAEKPADAAARQALAGSLSLLAGLHLGDADKERELHGKVIELRKALVAQEPLSTRRQLDLARAYWALGFLDVRVGGNPDVARGHYVSALDICQPLHQRDVGDTTVQEFLAAAHYNLATAYLLLDQDAEAADHFSKSLQQRELLAKQDAKNGTRKIHLMQSLARCGRHADAMLVANQLPPELKKDSRALYNLACAFVICAEAVNRSAKSQPLTREAKDLQQRYLSSAWEALEQAVNWGYNNADGLEHDPELRLLHADERWPQMLKTLKTSR